MVGASAPDQPYYCGEVNAPNMYGGLTGWHRVEVTPRGGWFEDDGSRDNRDIMDNMCANAAGEDVTALIAPPKG